jgi:signal transduction histidine kinase
VLLQVTDTGGGIPSEDIPRVFTRLYRADNVLIQGVGDTGVGLSIAKTLTEAQNGRIWVESEAGSGSTFSVLMPTNKGA